jgi:hypothetical protein
MIDLIVDRHNLRQTLATLRDHYLGAPPEGTRPAGTNGRGEEPIAGPAEAE